MAAVNGNICTMLMHTVSTIDKRLENKHEGQLEHLETLELHRSPQKSK